MNTCSLFPFFLFVFLSFCLFVFLSLSRFPSFAWNHHIFCSPVTSPIPSAAAHPVHEEPDGDYLWVLKGAHTVRVKAEDRAAVLDGIDARVARYFSGEEEAAAEEAGDEGEAEAEDDAEAEGDAEAEAEAEEAAPSGGGIIMLVHFLSS